MILATLEKAPLSEMGWDYWKFILFAVLILALGLWRLNRSIRRKQKWTALIILIIYGTLAAFLVFRAEGLRQPQSIPDPGIPAIAPAELPPVPES